MAFSNPLGHVALDYGERGSLGPPVRDAYGSVLLFKTADDARAALGPLGGDVRRVVRARIARKPKAKEQ